MRHKKGLFPCLGSLKGLVIVSNVKACSGKYSTPSAARYSRFSWFHPFFLLLSQSQFLCVWPAMACLLTAPFIGFLQVLQTVRRGPSDAERIPARCTDSGRATTNDMGRVLQRFRGSSKAWYGTYGNGSQMIKPIITHSYSYHICFGMKMQKNSTSCLGVASMDHPYYGDAECENEVCYQWMEWVI